MSEFWLRVRELEGRVLLTLHDEKPFRVVSVNETHARVVPEEGNDTVRAVRIDRIKRVSEIGLQRHELVSGARNVFQDSRNTSYIAAIAYQVASQTGTLSAEGTSRDAEPVA